MKIIDKTVTIDLMENQTSEDRRKLLQGAKKNFDFYFKNLSFAAFDIETTGLGDYKTDFTFLMEDLAKEIFSKRNNFETCIFI